MTTPEGARVVLEAGEEQMLKSSVALVQRFERKRHGEIKEADDDEGVEQHCHEDEDSLADSDGGGSRQQSHFSTNSTSIGESEDAGQQQQSGPLLSPPASLVEAGGIQQYRTPPTGIVHALCLDTPGGWKASGGQASFKRRSLEEMKQDVERLTRNARPETSDRAQ